VVPSLRAQVPGQRKESVCKMTRLFGFERGEDIPSETVHIDNEANGRKYKQKAEMQGQEGLQWRQRLLRLADSELEDPGPENEGTRPCQ